MGQSFGRVCQAVWGVSVSLEYYNNLTLQIYTIKCQKPPSKLLKYLQNRPFSAYMEFMGWKCIVMATIWSMKHAWHLLAFWEIQFWSWARFDHLSTPISPHLDIQETWGNTGFWDIFIYLTFGIIRVIDINYSLAHNRVKSKFFKISWFCLLCWIGVFEKPATTLVRGQIQKFLFRTTK